MTNLIVNVTKVKEEAHDKGYISLEYLEALDAEVRRILNRSLERAKANKRTTALARDL